MLKIRRLLHAGFRNLVSCGREVALPLAILVTGVLFQNVVSFVPWLVERFYSRAFYPQVLGALSFLSRRFGFSVGEVLMCLTLLVACAGALVFCAGVGGGPGSLVTAGGRVLTVTGRGTDLDRAVDAAYRAADRIAFRGRQLRSDIGRSTIPVFSGAAP